MRAAGRFVASTSGSLSLDARDSGSDQKLIDATLQTNVLHTCFLEVLLLLANSPEKGPEAKQIIQ